MLIKVGIFIYAILPEGLAYSQIREELRCKLAVTIHLGEVLQNICIG